MEQNYKFTEGLKQIESYLKDTADRQGEQDGLRWEGLARAARSFRKSYEHDKPLGAEI
ncbi:MAG: hypothetical protein J07AB43_04660 [Candidatus Nanosalina sp. J07AB43]|nr:MAG: hypothetical protein J07AB43_04660 [Candidatus Nanosalina sp. J07AB43]